MNPDIFIVTCKIRKDIGKTKGPATRQHHSANLMINANEMN